MKWWWQLSDAEFLERVRGQTRLTRRMGVFFILGALLFVVVGAGFVLHTLQTGVWPMFEDPTEKVPFQIGLISGFVLSLLLFFSFHCFSFGLLCLYEHRKDRLLIAYSQRLSELVEMPPTSEGNAV